MLDRYESGWACCERQSGNSWNSAVCSPESCAASPDFTMNGSEREMQKNRSTVCQACAKSQIAPNARVAIGVIFVMYAVLSICVASAYGQTDGIQVVQRRGPPPGRGPDATMRQDQDVFHYLLEHHQAIRREVKNLPDGVETLTESDSPEVAAKIQEHVAAMHARVKTGRGLRFWDDLFAEVFRQYKQIEMKVENTEKGVRVIETSQDPWAIQLIQAHAVVVSQFVARGFDEAHVDHPVPDRSAEQPLTASPETPLQYPIIKGYGGVVLVDHAVELPRKGHKVIFDIRSASLDGEAPHDGLVQVAQLLNLYGAAGLTAGDVRVCVVLQREAVKSAVSDESWLSRNSTAANPSLPLIRELKQSGVEVHVCGQSLQALQISRDSIDAGIPVALSAATAVLNRQSDGYTPILVH